jgi:hypothetical protein
LVGGWLNAEPIADGGIDQVVQEQRSPGGVACANHSTFKALPHITKRFISDPRGLCHWAKVRTILEVFAAQVNRGLGSADVLAVHTDGVRHASRTRRLINNQ